MADPVIHRVWTTETFELSWKMLPAKVQGEGIAVLASLAQPKVRPPWAKIELIGGNVENPIYAITITSDGRYKASFRIDGEAAYLRRAALDEYVY